VFYQLSTDSEYNNIQILEDILLYKINTKQVVKKYNKSQLTIYSFTHIVKHLYFTEFVRNNNNNFMTYLNNIFYKLKVIYINSFKFFLIIFKFYFQLIHKIILIYRVNVIRGKKWVD